MARAKQTEVQDAPKTLTEEVVEAAQAIETAVSEVVDVVEAAAKTVVRKFAKDSTSFDDYHR